MFCVYAKKRNEFNQSVQVYKGMNKRLGDAKRRLGRDVGYIQDYDTKQVILHTHKL